MAEARSLNPLVEQFRRGTVARDMRMMAAEGLLPLKPEDLLELWTTLVADPDEGVRGAADASLRGFPAPELLPILRNRDTPDRVLAWAVTHRPEPELREAALQNTSLADEVIEALAPTLTQALAELVVINQTRLLRCTPLLVALESNAGLSNDQKRRLRELRESFHIGQAAAVPVAAAPAAAPPPPPPAPAPEPEAALAPVEEIPTGDVVLTENEYTVKVLTEDERRQTEKVSVVQQIYRMDAKEKLLTALKGTREQRAILIRDPNRLIAMGVLGSPKITDAEIESISAMKNVSDQVLREIGHNREWTKRYAVISNLVRNPRTPIGIALNLVSRLGPRDVKSISVDRNVPEAVRKMAQKFVKQPQAR